MRKQGDCIMALKEGPQVDQEVVTRPSSLPDLRKKLHVNESGFDKDFSDLTQTDLDEVNELEQKLLGLHVSESVAPQLPSLTQQPLSGLWGTFGYKEVDSDSKARMEEYQKQLAAHQEQSKKHQSYQLQITQDGDALLKKFSDTIANQHLSAYNKRPTTDEIKKESGIENEQDWQAQQGVVSTHFQKSRKDQTEFTRPIVNGFKVLAHQAQQAYLNSEGQRIGKVRDFQVDPRAEAREMREAKQRAKLKKY